MIDLKYLVGCIHGYYNIISIGRHLKVLNFFVEITKLLFVV